MKKVLYTGPDFSNLHENYAKKGFIDEKAPIKSSSQIIINASIDKVWRVVYDIAKWTDFYPQFNKIKIASGVKTDAKFDFALNKFPISATFAVVNPERELSWTGSSLWTKAVDRMVLEPINPHTSRLKIEESLSGPFISLFISEKQLASQHNRWLTAIKNEVEKS